MDQTTFNTFKRIVLEKQESAAMLQTSCYQDYKPVKDCGLAIRGTIPYLATSDSKCPFREDVCLNRTDSAFTFDTDLQPVTNLGFNSPYYLTFRRKIICAPLVVNSSYTEHADPSNKYSPTRYRYGSISFADFGPNVTAEIPRPFDSLNPYSSSYYIRLVTLCILETDISD
jgi:hypothetical protein